MIVPDSSFLIAIHNSADAHHRSASARMDRFLSDERGHRLLLEYGFLKVVTVITLCLDLVAAIRVGRILREAGELEFEPCSDGLLETLDSFFAQTGTRLSFVDAAVEEAARQRVDGQIRAFNAEFHKLTALRVQKP